MIPLRDINPTRRRPLVTWALMAILTAVWAYQALSGEDLIGAWGMIPAELTEVGGAAAYLRIVTSMFIHAGWWHLLGNVWFLHVFGDNVEDELGRGPFLAFYLASGLAAAATHVAIAPEAPLPLVGASGAIAGVLGAYLVLHPRARVVALVIVFFAELPAWIFLFVWFGLQLAFAFSSLGTESTGGGVAFFAHVGGFVTGVLMMLALRRSKAEDERQPDDRIEPLGPAPR
ncbi:MAG: rhomboid family intramembrane serine protease [Sandaracinaceae bacterium]|nr:rhomboid family intramembrane serine protease [Sandaracinaceae bacterium]